MKVIYQSTFMKWVIQWLIQFYSLLCYSNDSTCVNEWKIKWVINFRSENIYLLFINQLRRSVVNYPLSSTKFMHHE